jgi:membrane protease YdiL (CAAX protease family)
LKKSYFFLLFLTIAAGASAQSTSGNKPREHSYYISILSGAKDSLYENVLGMYDRYLEQNPGDYLTELERCKFIEYAYYDEGEEFNPKYDEWEACKAALIEKYPEQPEIILYHVASLYEEDTVLNYCKRISDDYDKHPEKWEGKGIWIIYEKLAETYSRSDSNMYKNALEYARLAMAENDTLDLSLLMARQYKKLSQRQKAIDILVLHLDSTDRGWELNQKGKLLLELGAADKALMAFEMARKDTSGWIDNEGLAKALIENGMYDEARTYLVKDVQGDWASAAALQSLFDYDIQYSSADSARASYDRMVEKNFWNDPVGIQRLRLFMKSPGSYWTFKDLLHVLLLLALILAALIAPYIWLLPVHYIGKNRIDKGMLLPDSSFRWTMRHLWIACSCYLLVSALAIFIFEFNIEATSDGDKEISQNVANTSIFTMAGFLLATLILLRKPDISMITGTEWPLSKSIGKGIGLALLLKLCTGVYIVFLNKMGWGYDMDKPMALLTINESIMSINTYYHPLIGFATVALIVPVYEEILFRGVCLSAAEKYMKMFWANSFQATGFALVHQDWKLIPFYFAFGFIAGHLRNKSQSLAPGIVMHITNNALAFLAIWFLQSRM